MGIAFFLPHFGSPVVDVVLAQVSQLRRDLGTSVLICRMFLLAAVL